MTFDPDAANRALAGLRPFPVAVTTINGGFANGLMSLSAGSASIIPEAPRATISLTKYNKTHDMVLESGIFVMHMLSAEDDQIDKSLDILMTLGGRSGRDGDKISKLRTKTGVTGAPILLDAHSYVEARVTASLDVQESTIFVGDVVGAEILNDGGRLRIGEAWSKLPQDWIEQYDANHVPQLENARARRFGTTV
ncbi:NADH-FMN oxidoreductase RutF, flavin reductase (DIM6/NTAB) family [Rhodococcus rhodochrous J3]|uniref:Flavin reductase family protein n=2 Tax=Rhodococcus rhodochrous TaxID=1829 RepID=A0AA47AFV6_RHORH|nr:MULTISPECIES: flavin reductase family protein [Rhodococcus]MBF4476501.1 flavin reductase family protein [Rhodococcus rhodochrous]MCD2099296.1 flavin reductase family protein [Rhodococcus rhodochrous]MCD2123699.1 flavin reductase family protein [Rhodococcus rhodochrous]MCQ4136272.1 flavin reductase family protein [Rhodococcus rhodochrous]MDJ0020495.1 flavin reductase family protein [Rhodococcus rhodochrous]